MSESQDATTVVPIWITGLEQFANDPQRLKDLLDSRLAVARKTIVLLIEKKTGVRIP